MTRWSRCLIPVVLVLCGRLSQAAEAPPPAAVERHGSAFVDPLGFVMFGARLGVEAGSEHLTGALYGRWFDGAVLSRELFLREGDNFAFSWGAGMRGRYYLSPGQTGLHAGVGAELLRTRVETKSAMIAAISSYLVPYAEAGWRFSFQSFYADAGLALGYAARLGGHVENLPGGTGAATYMANDKSSVYGAGSLELGFFF